MVTNKAGSSAWIAVNEKDCYEIGVAMSDRDQSYLGAAESANAAFVVPVGTLVKVLGETESRMRLEVIEGPSAGKQGWVEFEFVRPRKNGEFR